MRDFVAQAIAELQSIRNIIHGPEIWLVFPLACLVAGVVGFFVFYKWEDDDDD